MTTPPADMHQDLPPRRFSAVLVVGFLAAIVLPSVTGLLRGAEDGIDVFMEQRLAAEAPALPADLEQARRFPILFEGWFNDHFGGRSTLIRWHNILKLYVFGATPHPRITLGRDGWIFVGEQDYTDYFRGVSPFSDEQLAVWREMLESKRDFLARFDIEFLFAIAPAKCTIYPEQMPARFDRVSETTRLDQLLAYMAEHSDVKLLDLRPHLAESVDEGLMYYPRGHHWNDLGAFHGARGVTEALRESFPAMPATDADAYEREVMHGVGEDSWATRLYITDLMKQEWVEFEKKRPPFFEKAELYQAGPLKIRAYENPGSPGPRVVLLHDSFGTDFAPLLAPSCSHLASISHDPNAHIDRQPVRSNLLRERPDVVVFLMAEIKLGHSEQLFPEAP